MLINHPRLGPRDISEFIYKGDVKLLDRPDWKEKDSANKFYEYLYLRENKKGDHKELWYHEQGDRSWLIVTRNTITHEIKDVEIARNVVMSKKNEK